MSKMPKTADKFATALASVRPHYDTMNPPATPEAEAWLDCVRAISHVLADGHPRFRRNGFVLECKTRPTDVPAEVWEDVPEEPAQIPSGVVFVYHIGGRQYEILQHHYDAMMAERARLISEGKSFFAIAWIKYLRSVLPLELKEAKDIVDAMRDQHILP
ncbi:MAG TPA: hypothetical protein VIV60_20310 [Polyangiaceae bacterium]